MDSSEWVTPAGHDWRILNPGPQGPDHLRLGMTLDYGLVDEGPSRIGTLALLSAALKADLQRSINVRDAQSPPPLVSVDVGTISTTVMIEGRSRAVLAAWDRLGELLTGPDGTGRTGAHSQAGLASGPGCLHRRQCADAGRPAHSGTAEPRRRRRSPGPCGTRSLPGPPHLRHRRPARRRHRVEWTTVLRRRSGAATPRGRQAAHPGAL